MTLFVLLSIAAAIVQAYILFRYAQFMRKGYVKPSRVTWFGFALLSGTVCAGMAQAGTLNGLIIAGAVGNAAIFLLSLRYGQKAWGKIDIFALVGFAVAFTAWRLTNEPVVAILGSLVVVQIASLPTYAKVWHNPKGEPLNLWSLALVPPMLQVLAIEQWVVEQWAQPVFYFITPTVVVALLIRGRIRAERSAKTA